MVKNKPDRFKFRAWTGKKMKHNIAVHNGRACTDEDFNFHGGHEEVDHSDWILMQSTGMCDTNWKDAQSLGKNPWYVQTSAIESFGKLK